MKLLLFTDNHFCESSSIIRSQGKQFSTRLENQIDSLNWVEEVAVANKVDSVVCLGDFFDKPILNDRELTALKQIKWSTINHYFIVGNHESSVNNLYYNSTKSLESETRKIISSPQKMDEQLYTNLILALPYEVETDRKPLSEYILPDNEPRIILSHNDIKGIQMGAYLSTEGFSIEEIEQSCDLFINGHLHNGTKISDKIVNLGNLTGQNFSEDATRYSHNIMLLDTDTLKYELIENPYAFNFYNISIVQEKDLIIFSKLKNNSVLSIKCRENLIDKVNEKLSEPDIVNRIIAKRLIITREVVSTEKTITHVEEFNMNHLDKFREFTIDKLGNSETILQELNEVCK